MTIPLRGPKGPRVGIRFLAVLILATGCGSAQPTSPTRAQPPATRGGHEVTIAGAGVALGGLLFRPETAEPRPAIVVVHGWLPSGTYALLPEHEARAQRYANEGYVALAMALRGWPPSGGADDCALRQPDDVAAVVLWLRAQPGVLPDRIGIVGFSQGGQVALMTGARDSGLRALVAYYPVTDVARWKVTTDNPGIPGYIAAVCEPDVAARSPLLHADRIAPPVLLVHGDRDRRVPTDQSELLHAARTAAGRPSELLLVPGAAHGFNGDEESFARPIVDDFLAARLRR